MEKLLVIVTGIIFFMVGIFSYVNGKELNSKCTAETEGTIIEIKVETDTSEDGKTTYKYYPVISYKVGDRTIIKESNVKNAVSKYSVNDKVAILYNPNNIEEYIIKGEQTLNFLSIIFMVTGGLVFILGIVKAFNE